jgi:hypothetical protein
MTASIKVTGIRVRPLVVPLRRPLVVSFGTFTEGPFLAIEVETKGGVMGTLLAFAFHQLGLSPVPQVLEQLIALAKRVVRA